jgi:hypothetical protein
MKSFLGLVLLLSLSSVSFGADKKPEMYTVIKATRGYICGEELDSGPCVLAEATKGTSFPGGGYISYVAATYVITHGNVVSYAYFDYAVLSDHLTSTDPVFRYDNTLELAPIPLGVPLKMEASAGKLCWDSHDMPSYRVFTFCFSVYQEEMTTPKKKE